MRDFITQPIGALDTDTPERVLRYLGLPRHEAQARITEATHRRMEDEARRRRLDRDRIIQTALDTLEIEASHLNTGELDGAALGYIAGASGVSTAHLDGEHKRIYIRELLVEIRAELSPVVTGRATDDNQ